MFRTKSLLALAALPAALMLSACFESPNDSKNNNGGDTTLVVPATYAFIGTDSLSSVDYAGQTERLLLISDIQSFAQSPGAATYTGGAITAAQILKYYQHLDSDSLSIRTSVAGGKTLFFTKYAQLAANKSLHDKASPAVVIGYGVPMDTLVRRWAALIAKNSEDSAKRKTKAVYLDSNDVNVAQLISKGLAGAVAYHQAVGVYLQQIGTKNNTDVVAGKNYTEMEHNWDEAFGYFGAARNYDTYADTQLDTAALSYRDDNNDGKIDPRSEYNFSMMGRYVARRDRGLSQDWSGDAFLAFRKGRALISKKGSATEIAAQRAIIAEVWDKTFASNVIAYIRNVKDILDTIPANPSVDTRATLGGQWGELKAFAICLQYSPYKKATDAQLAQLHTLIGNGPVRTASGKAAYIANLNAAHDLLKGIYGFSDQQVTSPAWR